jgi:hypothetical protein
MKERATDTRDIIDNAQSTILWERTTKTIKDAEPITINVGHTTNIANFKGKITDPNSPYFLLNRISVL